MLHKTWGAVAGSLLLLVVFFAPANAQDVSAADQTAAQLVIRDQLSAFKEADYDRAFSHAAPNIKDIFKDSGRFISMVRGGYKQLLNLNDYLFGRSRLEGGQVFQELIATDGNGKQWQAIYTLQQQPDGSWKITGVHMQPYQGAAT